MYTHTRKANVCEMVSARAPAPTARARPPVDVLDANETGIAFTAGGLTARARDETAVWYCKHFYSFLGPYINSCGHRLHGGRRAAGHARGRPP